MVEQKSRKNPWEWLYRWSVLAVLGFILKFAWGSYSMLIQVDTARQLQEVHNIFMNRRIDVLELSGKKNTDDHKRYEILFARIAVSKKQEWPELVNQKE